VGTSSGVSAKQSSGSGGGGSPVRQPGVDETQPGVLDAEDLGRLGHLVAADIRDAPVHLRQVHRRVEDVAAFASGQGHHQHAQPSSA
jgi:hypothetical protein